MKWKAIVAAISLSALLVACAENEPSADPRAADGGTGAENPTTGDEYAAELGLVPHAYDEGMDLATTERGVTLDGKPLKGCESSPGIHISMSILESGTIYCYTWTDELEAWITGQRLQGRVPTEGEIADREAELSRD